MDTWLDGFLVSFLESKKSLLNVSLCIVSSIEKCWRAKKYHLNLIISCRMWLKFSTTLNSMPLIQSVCAALKWTQGTLLVLYIEVRLLSKRVSLARGFEFMRATPEISFRKAITTDGRFQWHRLGCKTCLLVWHIQPVQWTQSLQGRAAVLKWVDTVAAPKAKLELWGRWVNIGISNISRDFERDWSRAFFLPESAWSPISALKRVWALLPNHKRPPNWEGMDPWPICKQARWIKFVHALRESTA